MLAESKELSELHRMSVCVHPIKTLDSDVRTVRAELGGAAAGDCDVHGGHYAADPGGAPRQLRDHQAAAGPRRRAARATRRALRLRRVRALALRGFAAPLALQDQRLQSAGFALAHRTII